MIRRSTVCLCAILLLALPAVAQNTQQPPDVNALLGALGGTQGGGSPALKWQTLAQHLPEIEGMEKDKIDGGTFNVANPMTPEEKTNYSTVTRRFYAQMGSSGTKEIIVTILDSGFATMMLAPFMMAVEFDTPDGSMKSGEVEGFKAKFMEELDDDMNVTRSQVMVHVAGEVLVTAEGNRYVKPAELKTVVGDMDLPGLKAKKEAAVAEEE